MLVKHRVDNDRDERREESARAYFGDEYEQRTGLENSAAKMLVSSSCARTGGRKIINIPSTSHERPMAFLHSGLDIHREVLQTIDLKSLANTA